MTITLTKPILIIMLICLALIVICGIAAWILKRYQKMSDKEQERIIAGVGTYDEDKNRNNRTFLVGKGDTRGEADE